MSWGNSGDGQTWRLMCTVWVWAISCSILVLSRINLTRIARGLISFWNHISENTILNWFFLVVGASELDLEKYFKFWSIKFLCHSQIFISNKIKTFTSIYFLVGWLFFCLFCDCFINVFQLSNKTRYKTSQPAARRSCCLMDF